MTSDPNMPTSVLNVPETCAFNSYVDLVSRAQRELGLEVLRPGLCDDAPDARPAAPDHPLLVDPQSLRHKVIHLHWPEKLALQIGVACFRVWIHAAKRAGATVVRTLHNLAPHERGANADDDVEGFLRGMTDALHVFSRRQRAIVERRSARAGSPRIIVAPHPTYESELAAEELTPRLRLERKRALRREHGVPDDGPVLAMVGRIRGYKNLLLPLEALAKAPNERLSLLVAGCPDDAAAVDALQRRAKRDGRVHLRLELMSEQTYAELLFLADFALLPTFRPWSSGTAVHAANLRVPIVGYLPAMFDLSPAEEAAAGVFVNAETSEAFATAMMSACRLPGAAVAAMGDAAARLLGGGDRRTVAAGHAALYGLRMGESTC